MLSDKIKQGKGLVSAYSQKINSNNSQKINKIGNTIFLFLHLIMIGQSAFSLTIISYAGSLATSVGADLSAATNLPITGTTNAIEVKCTRKNKPLLAVLDISGVNIADTLVLMKLLEQLVQPVLPSKCRNLLFLVANQTPNF